MICRFFKNREIYRNSGQQDVQIQNTFLVTARLLCAIKNVSDSRQIKAVSYTCYLFLKNVNGNLTLAVCRKRES